MFTDPCRDVQGRLNKSLDAILTSGVRLCVHMITHMCVYVHMCKYTDCLQTESRGFHEILKGICDGHPPIHSALPSETCKSSHPGMGNFTVQQPSMNMSLFMSCGSLIGQKCGVPVRRGPASGCQGLFYLLCKPWVLWLIVLTFRIVPKWCVCVCSQDDPNIGSHKIIF